MMTDAQLGSVAPRESIVEERMWRQGVEMVSRVNYTHLARVRSLRGIMPDELIGRRAWFRPLEWRTSRRGRAGQVALVS